MFKDSYHQKSALITGATGFIGANLVRRLLLFGTRCHVLVRPSANMWRLRDVDVDRWYGDLTDATTVVACVDRIRPDFIFHLATCRTEGSPDEQCYMMQTNIFGTATLLEACRTLTNASIVCTGSSLEYGHRSVPLREDLPPQPSGMFGISKNAATAICQMEHRQFGTRVAVLRLFHVYGYWEHPGRLVPAAIMSAMKRQSLRLTQRPARRDFVFIDDVIEACLRAASSDASAGEIINVGSGIQHTNEDIIRTLEDIVGEKLKIDARPFPRRRTDTDYWVADISRAADLLAWTPQTSLHEGLTKTFEWMKSHQPACPEYD